MTAHFLHGDPVYFSRQQSPERGWVAVGSAMNQNYKLTPGTPQTKLLFNEGIPASALNRATLVGPPAPIVIERWLPRSEMCESDNSTSSSFSFTTISEERLQAAINLAKRDLRRRHRESLRKLSAEPLEDDSLFETSGVEPFQKQGATPSKTKPKTSSPKEKAFQHVSKQFALKKYPTSSKPCAGKSPPTRDPGLMLEERGKQAPLSHEICKLQNELEVYIQKVEELSNRGQKTEGLLEPEEQSKLDMRRQKQAARSSRVIYVLQQQVKEIQEDIEKLRREKMWETKKSSAINRLAAAHRGALRALQVIIQQLSDLSHSKLPPHCKEMGQLIRQLSLCSAKVGLGSAVPETALDILQKLEILDSALSKQEMLENIQAQSCPPRRKSPHRSMSPSTAPKGPSVVTAGRTIKPTNPKRVVRGRRMASQKPKTSSQKPVNRQEVLRSVLKMIGQQRELEDLQEQSQMKATYRKGPHAEKRKAGVIKVQHAGFQQPTVSSRLRVNQLPQKEQTVPWIPTSPHSPPPQRSPQRGRAEPRCLFSAAEPSLSPPKQQVGGGLEAQLTLSSTKRREAQTEALKSEVSSIPQWAEQKARERVQPLLMEAQTDETRNRINTSLRSRLTEQGVERAAENIEELSEALLEDLLEDSARVAWAAETDKQLEGLAQCRLQAPTLESMLLRMEEIQRDEEEVRRRFASITYSDPLFWDRPGVTAPQGHASGSRPASPQPIRLTRPGLKQTPAVDIVLKKPVEIGHSFLFENSPTGKTSQDEQMPTNNSVFHNSAERHKATVISVPGNMLRNIQRYRDDYDAYLRTVAHGTVYNFDPWALADSLAEELLSEALADVAAEFQDVAEEYAEAVFTSEFLQPIHSPPASTTALVSQ
ncbi:protein moonraker isoform X2 [Cololabis saira]|uniref:protein moonraker isoform X2 n=1 Tax=Cololabis saira TaxID=129043 RepID=UPI002AD3F481|nr:protein moonraker isoform X2 [Cololabis saira]